MSVFDLMRPAAVVPEIEDAEVVKENYKYWRWRIFCSMYLGYVFYYFTRKSLTFAMPALIQDLHFQMSDLGLLSSILSITYGASKFLSGVLSDRSNPRFFMAIGLIITGLMNLCFSLSSSLVCFALFWGLNGWFQGWGWPPCARLLTHWYSQKERGVWWGLWNTSHSVGGALIPLLAACCAQYFGWRSALYIPGFLGIGVGLFLINRLRDTPQSLGLPIERFKNDFTHRPGEENEISAKEILFKYVLNNWCLWVLACSYFFVYFIRQTVNDFGALFLMQTKGYSLLSANTSVFWFECGGILGSLAAGWFSDKIFKGQRGPVNVLFCLGVVFAIFGLYVSPPGMTWLDYSLMFITGFLIFGPQMLVGMIAAEISHKKAAGTATGFVGWIAYLGAAAGGYPISKVAEKFGWFGFFLVLVSCSVLAVVLLFPLWNVGKRTGAKATA